MAYVTFGELERGFLHQIRRFRRACGELAASRVAHAATAAGKPITLNAPDMHVAPAPRAGGDAGLSGEDQRQLELLRSQTILLQNMSAQILTNFPGNAKAEDLRRRIDAMCKTIEAQGESLREMLGRQARSQVDRAVVARNHRLMEHLRETLGKSVGGITEMYLVGDVVPPGAQGEATRADVAYLRLTELRGPDGFVHPSYYVITAHPRGGEDMLVSAGPEYRVPNRVRWMGTARRPADLDKVCMHMLLGEGVIGKTFDRDLPVPAGDVRFVHDNVKSTKIEGNQIVVRVKRTAEIEETRAALRRQLSGLVRQADPKNRDVIRDRVDKTRGTITLTFSLPGSLRGRVVDRDVLRRLGVTLDLDASTLQRVRTAIENPE